MATSSPSLSGPLSPLRRILGNDPWLIILTAALVMVGLLSLFSIESVRPIGGVAKKQVFFAIAGIVPLLLFWKTPLDVWRRAAPMIYTVDLALLLLVLFRAKSAKGAGRWIDIGPLQFQPSELNKIAVILMLAAFFASRDEDEIQRPITFWKSLALVAPTMLLIKMQPHLGATVGVFCIWSMVCIAARVPWRTLGSFLLAGIAAIAIIIKVKPDLILEDYQAGRLRAIKTNDVKGADYQITGAKKAFGMGGVMGSGFRRGEQKRLGYVPEQYNDFIFTVVGEEGGLIGSTMVLGLFLALYLRIWAAGMRTQEMFPRLIAIGVVTILSFQTVVNLGMNLEILPVVGLGLPFISSGGTALMITLGLVGLALAVSDVKSKIF